MSILRLTFSVVLTIYSFISHFGCTFNIQHCAKVLGTKSKSADHLPNNIMNSLFNVINWKWLNKYIWCDHPLCPFFPLHFTSLINFPLFSFHLSLSNLCFRSTASWCLFLALFQSIASSFQFSWSQQIPSVLKSKGSVAKAGRWDLNVLHHPPSLHLPVKEWTVLGWDVLSLVEVEGESQSSWTVQLNQSGSMNGLLPWRAADKRGWLLHCGKGFMVYGGPPKELRTQRQSAAALKAPAAPTFNSPTVPFICHTHSHCSLT